MADANSTDGNPSESTPSAAPPSRGRIRFDAHHSGTLNTRAGDTCLGHLPAIFALLHTRCGSLNEPFQTDRAGLKRLADICESAEEYLVDGMGAVGELLARADEPSSDTVRSTGWLLRGLADLCAEVQRTQSDARFHLKNHDG